MATIYHVTLTRACTLHVDGNTFEVGDSFELDERGFERLEKFVEVDDTETVVADDDSEHPDAGLGDDEDDEDDV